MEEPGDFSNQAGARCGYTPRPPPPPSTPPRLSHLILGIGFSQSLTQKDMLP